MGRKHLVGSELSKAALARSLGVSRQALYYTPVRPHQDEQLRDRVLRTLDIHPGYGHRRIALHLKINKKRVLRIMRLYAIRTKIQRRKYPKKMGEIEIVTTPNRIKRVSPIQPDAIWAGDFTHFWFHGRIIYLATVIDLFSREIIGWQIGLHHTTSLVIDVLKEAERKRGRTPQYFHSDQGSEYVSHACTQWIVRHHITPSLSPKGKPWNNGAQESFYRTLKLEFGKPQRHATLDALIEGIGKYMHYYNTLRIHGKLKMPPRQYCEMKRWNNPENPRA